MKPAFTAIATSCLLLIAAPSAEASKLSSWIDKHVVPHPPSSTDINKAVNQTNATAIDAQKAINDLAPKITNLATVSTWGGGSVLGLLSLMLIGKNVAVWRQALAKKAQVA